MLLRAAIVIYSVLSVTWTTIVADYCICTRHVETRAFPCITTRVMPWSFLYGDIPGEDCMPEAANVITKHGWKAGILYNKVVYVEEDHNVVRKSCNQVASPPFTFDKSCPPIMKPGTNLNPATATTSTTSTTATSTTTPAPTTRHRATATSPTTTATTTKVPATAPHHVQRTKWTQPFVLIGINEVDIAPASGKITKDEKYSSRAPGQASTKCVLPKLLQRLASKTPASHPMGKRCPDQTHRDGDALMLEACINANINPMSWKKELKVIDHCYNIPKGEPLAIYAGPMPLPIYAHFWNCLGGNSFEILFQACGSPPIIENAANRFTADMFYSISW